MSTGYALMEMHPIQYLLFNFGLSAVDNVETILVHEEENELYKAFSVSKGCQRVGVCGSEEHPVVLLGLKDS